MMVKKAGLGARLKVMTDSDYAANPYPSVFQSQWYVYSCTTMATTTASKVNLRRVRVKVYAMHKFLLTAVPISQLPQHS